MPGGPPPDGHPRQCQTRMARHNGRQCRRWALKGSNYCQFHGGRTAKKRGIVRIDTLPHFYSKHLSKSLAESIKAALEEAPREQVAIFEELALMKETVKPTLLMWDAAMTKLEAQADDPQVREAALAAQAAAGALLRDQLKEVAGLAEAANRIMLQGKEHYSIHSLMHIVNQIIKISYDVFEDDIERAERFEMLVRERIRMPVENKGTMSTPDLDVAEMDSTVPRSGDE